MRPPGRSSTTTDTAPLHLTAIVVLIAGAAAASGTNAAIAAATRSAIPRIRPIYAGGGVDLSRVADLSLVRRLIVLHDRLEPVADSVPRLDEGVPRGAAVDLVA